ncbi:hypothetical protein HUW63_32470 [Myxococcus sp. AM001]|nr:hypothetical protein [Myxococcus sp. AM001]
MAASLSCHSRWSQAWCLPSSSLFLLGACGADSTAGEPGPAITFEEHMANVRGFVAEAEAGTVTRSWQDYPSVNPVSVWMASSA